MNVNPSRRSLFVIFGAIGVVVFISLAVWNYALQESEVSAKPAARGAPAAEPAVEADVAAETQEDAADDAEQMDPARRIVHVPDTRPIKPDEEPPSRPLTRAVVADFAAEAIEASLNGDMQSVNELLNLQQACTTWIPRNEAAMEEAVERTLAAVVQAEEAGNTVPPDGQMTMRYAVGNLAIEQRIYPTEQQNREHLAEWSAGCRNVRKYFDRETRAELELLARDGHVMARYLYALWVPELTADPRTLEEYVQWERNALEFSSANVADGEFAGLAAFAYSFSANGFTGRNVALGSVLWRAVSECGSTQNGRTYVFEPFRDGDHELGYTDLTAEELNALVAQFAEKCR